MPLLSASHFDGFGKGNASVSLCFSFHSKFDRMNVFAWLMTSLEIGACAKWLTTIQAHYVTAIAGLRVSDCATAAAARHRDRRRADSAAGANA